ncbi:hypothetical protein INT43_008375 [Umbelopsis isabellina]|uniref:Uncharacterized protein n=1 Tax=Mortierella isabellina TaxID=91625 RepID=A0A8H7PDF7_MORIS|nr:hypothetical protein INT43_008375 [Umbelopsis isabellina]
MVVIVAGIPLLEADLLHHPVTHYTHGGSVVDYCYWWPDGPDAGKLKLFSPELCGESPKNLVVEANPPKKKSLYNYMHK